MMVCMKMLPEWRREEQSFVRRRLGEKTLVETQRTVYLRMRTVLALVLSIHLRRLESQRSEGRASSRRLEGVVECRLVRAWPVKVRWRSVHDALMSNL